jgi:D-alanine-D-alanine ligase
MTTFRTLFEAMKIPMVGCDGPLMSLSTNKAHTRLIVENAGVPVAKGELLHKGDKPTMSPPFVLKPCSEDNSMGISLFTGKNGQDLDEALETAFGFDDEVLCEKFVPLGREIRVGVLELDDGSLDVLPGIEYILDPDEPIRTSAAKLSTDSRGVATKPNPSTRRKCPADIDPVLQGKLEQLATRAHRALGCRDYSLYDVRVDPEGEPYMLEACLYCSFAPKSVIVLMAGAKDMTQQEVFEMLVERNIARHEKRQNDNSQILGMKAK